MHDRNYGLVISLLSYVLDLIRFCYVRFSLSALFHSFFLTRAFLYCKTLLRRVKRLFLRDAIVFLGLGRSQPFGPFVRYLTLFAVSPFRLFVLLSHAVLPAVIPIALICTAYRFQRADRGGQQFRCMHSSVSHLVHVCIHCPSPPDLYCDRNYLVVQRLAHYYSFIYYTSRHLI